MADAISTPLQAPARTRGLLYIRDPRSRTVVAGLAVLLPGPLRRFAHTRLLGYRLAPTASIGRSFVDVEELEMRDGARIGSLCAIRGCTRVVLGEGAEISMLVWVNAVRMSSPLFRRVANRRPELIMGKDSVITSMHFIDACDQVEVGDYAAIAGFGSIVQTHAVDIVRMKQSCAPVRIGHHAMIATRGLLLPGVQVPDGAIIGAGAVVATSLPDPMALYGGVPAKKIRDLDPAMPFFHRTHTTFL